MQCLIHIKSNQTFDINCHCGSIIDFLANSYFIVQTHYAKSFKMKYSQFFIGIFIKMLKSLVRNSLHQMLLLIKSPESPQVSKKNFRAEILTIFSLLFWSKRWHQKDISKLTDLYIYQGRTMMFKLLLLLSIQTGVHMIERLVMRWRWY